jgi:thioredoxin 1
MYRTETCPRAIRRSLTCRRTMWLVVVGVALLALATVFGGCGGADPAATTDSTIASSTSTNQPQTSSPIAGSGLPQLIDLGSDSCVPCQMMAPELEALAAEYAGSVEVVIVDVNNTKEGATLAQQLSIRVIPTQVFIDPAGNELRRHEGYISKDDMVALFHQLGYSLKRVGPVNPDATQGGG